MGSRPRFRSPCVTAPAHLLPYAPLYPLLPVLTHGAASYPPGLAALCRVPAVLRGLRLAWSPLAIASRRPRSSPNPGYCLPARSAAPPSPPLIPLCLSTGWTRRSPSSLFSLSSSLLLPDELSPSSPLRFLPASDPSPPPHRVGSPPAVLSLFPLSFCRMGRRPRSRGACGQTESPVRSGTPPPRRVSGAVGSAPRRPGGEESRPSPLGRAAEHARSAARASSGHPPPLLPAPISPSAWGGRRPSTFVSPAMPPTGWLGGVRIRQRTDLRR